MEAGDFEFDFTCSVDYDERVCANPWYVLFNLFSGIQKGELQWLPAR